MVLSTRELAPLPLAATLVVCLTVTAILVTALQSPSAQPVLDRITLFHRLAFLAGAVCLFLRNIETAGIALALTKSPLRAPFWVFAFQSGWFYWIGCILILWQGFEMVYLQIAVWFVISAAFGTFVAWLATGHRRANLNLARAAYYNTDHTVTAVPSGRLFYYGWPVLAIVVAGALLMFPPANGWEPRFLIFLLILLGSLPGPLYPSIAPRDVFVLQAAGIALIFLGLVV